MSQAVLATERFLTAPIVGLQCRWSLLPAEVDCPLKHPTRTENTTMMPTTPTKDEDFEDGWDNPEPSLSMPGKLGPNQVELAKAVRTHSCFAFPAPDL
jgi:hypothetical protein